MLIEERQQQILQLLAAEPHLSVREMARRLWVSEPTVRRDLTELERNGFVKKHYGGAALTRNGGAADDEIPFSVRQNEQSTTKTLMGKRAARLVKDGMVLLLDGSTSAYHLVPFLRPFKDLIVITSGARTAVALAEANIKTFCTGGQMIVHSFSYVGGQAERFVRDVNADLLFFSCRGVSEAGMMTDLAVEEANLRRVMFAHAARRVLLCDGSKFGKTYFYNIGHIGEVDDIVSDVALPDYCRPGERR